MPNKRGHCTACGKKVWRFIRHPYTDKEIALWPLRDSLYIKTETDSGYTVGLPYCQRCCPQIGTPGPADLLKLVRGPDGVVRKEPMGPLGNVVGIETAHERHQYDHFSDRHGDVLRAWLKDGAGARPFFDDVTIAGLMTEWDLERTTVEVKSATVGEPDDGRRDT